MNFAEEDYIMISALQHYRFCPRQFALVHLDKYWGENFFTRDGKHKHERVDLPGAHRSAGRRVEYALPLANCELGIYGVADAVEFLNEKNENTVAPVEYKRGKEKTEDCDEIQLCAQVLCLEKMMHISIKNAWLFYFETRSRVEVSITEELRNKCIEVIEACHLLLSSGEMPKAVYSPKKCRPCSLFEYCMPPEKLRSYRDDFEEALL